LDDAPRTLQRWGAEETPRLFAPLKWLEQRWFSPPHMNSIHQTSLDGRARCDLGFDHRWRRVRGFDAVAVLGWDAARRTVSRCIGRHRPICAKRIPICGRSFALPYLRIDRCRRDLVRSSRFSWRTLGIASAQSNLTGRHPLAPLMPEIRLGSPCRPPSPLAPPVFRMPLAHA
jgi:hypothetical protein